MCFKGSQAHGSMSLVGGECWEVGGGGSCTALGTKKREDALYDVVRFLITHTRVPTIRLLSTLRLDLCACPLTPNFLLDDESRIVTSLICPEADTKHDPKTLAPRELWVLTDQSLAAHQDRAASCL